MLIIVRETITGVGFVSDREFWGVQVNLYFEELYLLSNRHGQLKPLGEQVNENTILSDARIPTTHILHIWQDLPPAVRVWLQVLDECINCIVGSSLPELSIELRLPQVCWTPVPCPVEVLEAKISDSKCEAVVGGFRIEGRCWIIEGGARQSIYFKFLAVYFTLFVVALPLSLQPIEKLSAGFI